MPRLLIGLSVSEINFALREIQKWKEQLKTKIAALIEALAKEGAEIAKLEVKALGAKYTGQLEESITGFFDPVSGRGIIRAGSPYAVFVEFGTGIVGKSSPHPSPKGWNYDVNDHGDKGWLYFNDRDGKFHWTKGMKSRPFMYNTARKLENECARIARGVFGND